MSQYRPDGVPPAFDPELRRYLDAELHGVARALEVLESRLLALANFGAVSALPNKLTGGEVARVSRTLIGFDPDLDGGAGGWELLQRRAYGYQSGGPTLGTIAATWVLVAPLTVPWVARGVAFDGPTGSFVLDRYGIFSVGFRCSLTHNEVNAGRNIRLGLFADGAFVASWGFGTGRNQETTLITFDTVAPLDAGVVYDWRLSSTADTYTGCVAEETVETISAVLEVAV